MSEPTPRHPGTGWIEVIVGSMYSGKTEELIRRLRRAQIARQRVEIFKPAIDNRYSQDDLVSHSELRIPSRSVKSAQEILRYAHEAQVIGIDEGQFLGPDLVRVCERLARRGKRVIVAGLDQDYAARPFEPMPQLLAIAEYITKTLAICVVCGNPANRTYRKKRRSERVVVGGSDLYEARCRRCYELGRRAKPPGEDHPVPPRAGRAKPSDADEPAPPRAGRTKPPGADEPVTPRPGRGASGSAKPKRAGHSGSPASTTLTGGSHAASHAGPRRRRRARRRGAARGLRQEG